MESTVKINDKAYVMARLHEAIKLGVINEALSLITENDQAESAANWAQVRERLDAFLSSVENNGHQSAYSVRYEEA